MEIEQFLNIKEIKELKVELTRFMMAYKFALDEMNTKISILQDEFNFIHDYNPIEHVKSRLKSPESILKKVYRKDFDFTLASIKENIKDIAGIRITCSFRSDIYEISKMIANQKDVRVVEYKDYIQNPKPNGYQSLHLILEVPIFMSDREELVYVEVQIRTIAMDFWASLEHKIYYKYNEEVPQKMIVELKEAATMATHLDQKMERLHKEISVIKEENKRKEETSIFNLVGHQFSIPMLETLMEKVGDRK
ncbi:GTP pyrophosphokinase family protein [Bacillus salipaludis]|uniref:GTP pyrophosphokinase family protein n=1 Tax=Bacillus salipaludis TaxID=2547811 RepID=A0A4R5VVQ9_9BACI|nr:GTP pyrophosphokinase family protein [Bacillus salipaludis]MDQ6597457.1 GTP pyrophosphokinase family protein [Bacillus salipaludis]TDK63117.1 GTP pyrophosphokinase family protein [Bacillus salipaludis]